MAESITEVYNPSLDGSSSFYLGLTSWTRKPNKRSKSLGPIRAPEFKYRSNSSPEELQIVRDLLKEERLKQQVDDFDFWTPDFERMMVDDWLVTRFLLRGTKVSKKIPMNPVDEKSKYLCTMELMRSCAEFRREYRVNGKTKREEFPIEWTVQDGLFNYKPDLVGNPTVYLRTKLHQPKLIETKEARHEFKRLLLYTLEQCDQDLENNPGKAICCVFDLSDATFENVDLELVSWMIKSFKSCSPKLLCYVIIYNLPWFFSATFKLISSTLMSNSSKQVLKFVYGDEILNYIEYDNLPGYLKHSL